MIKKRRDIAKLLPRRGAPVVVEIGSWKGDYADVILQSHPTVRLVLVDLWMPETINIQTIQPHPDHPHLTGDECEAMYQSVCERFKPYGDRVEVVREYSTDAAAFFNDATFDLIYIDANHRFQPVVDDIRAWWPKLKVHGWMAGHDYNNKGGKQVKKAVDTVFATGINSTEESPGTWFIEKTEHTKDYPHGRHGGK